MNEVVTLQLPTNLYAQLQQLAEQEQLNLIELINIPY